jgi:hypothetical protein
VPPGTVVSPVNVTGLPLQDEVGFAVAAVITGTGVTVTDTVAIKLQLADASVAVTVYVKVPATVGVTFTGLPDTGELIPPAAVPFHE